MAVSLTLSLPESTLRRYARAARELRKALGGASPTTEQLIVHELTDRAPQVIVSDQMEKWKARRRRRGAESGG